MREDWLDWLMEIIFPVNCFQVNYYFNNSFYARGDVGVARAARSKSQAEVGPDAVCISPFMKVFSPLIHFLFHIGYLGPLVMGTLDSSFLILPFGNDLLVVGMVARHPQGVAWFVLSAAAGSTIGACLLAMVSKKLGEEGIRKIAGKSRYEMLKKRIGNRSGFAVALAGLAPPPFPFTTVIAAVGALGYPLWRIVAINFFTRGARFTILSILALKFGTGILHIAQSRPFEWSMVAFIVFCFVATCFSLVHWLRQPRARSMASRTGN